nr:hypothetical protein [uncultured Lichenicoccus sp.]
MEQTLLYRDVRYVIGPEQDGRRRWSIHPDGSTESGFVSSSGLRGSFKTAVFAAREAIDAWLDPQPESEAPEPSAA